MNKISPGAVAKFKQSGPAFLLMENVQAFLAAIKKYGVPDEEVFQTPDLFEARNISQVTLCLYALARTTQKHPEYSGPQMGPKMATKNERNFTEEQIRQGRDGQVGLQVISIFLIRALFDVIFADFAITNHNTPIINFQAGSNKGASQSGQGGMGNTRHM